jgi:hypothetical protein
MLELHFEHLPRRIIKLKIGIFSYHKRVALHFGQKDEGAKIEIPLGIL